MRFWGLAQTEDMVLVFTIAFTSAALTAGGLRLLLLWTINRVCFSTGADLSTEVYLRTLHQPYSVHVTRNSSTVIAGVQKVSAAIDSLRSFLFGAGATVRQSITIGEGVIVGAGAAVVKDVPAHTVVVGVPARPLRMMPVTKDASLPDLESPLMQERSD